MLRINPIKNVQYTLNNTLTFKAGEQTNYGVFYSPKPGFMERSLLTGFAGMIQETFAKLNPKAATRAQSIEAGMTETKKLNKVA